MASLLAQIAAKRPQARFATPITKWLYLGSGRDASNLDELKRHRITHILNVADDVPCYFQRHEATGEFRFLNEARSLHDKNAGWNFSEEGENCESTPGAVWGPEEVPTDLAYCHLQVADFGTDKGISRVFNEAFEFVDGALRAHLAERQTRILVHCAHGVNRSSTVAIAVLVHISLLVSTLPDWTVADAYEHVVSCRPQIMPLRDNREQLYQWERSVRRVALGQPDPSSNAELDLRKKRVRSRQLKLQEDPSSAPWSPESALIWSVPRLG